MLRIFGGLSICLCPGNIQVVVKVADGYIKPEQSGFIRFVYSLYSHIPEFAEDLTDLTVN